MKLFRSCEDLHCRTAKNLADYYVHVQILPSAVLQVAETALVNKCHKEHVNYNLIAFFIHYNQHVC